MTGTKYGVPSAQLNPATPYANYATYNKLQTFIYDKVGNRQEFDDGTITYLYNRPAGGGAYSPSNVNEYYRIRVSVTDINRTYDANGNLTNDGNFAYKYNFKNQLIEVDPAGGGAAVQTNNYNCFGLRIFKTVGTATTYYELNGPRVIETHDGSDNVIASFVFGDWIDEVLTSNIGGSTYYASQQALFSVVFWSDASANNVEKVTYTSFGQTTNYAWLAGAWVTVTDSKVAPFMFTGREYDSATAEFYYRARYMSPLEGRFTTRDPIPGIPGPDDDDCYHRHVRTDALSNQYTYADNAPTSTVDPMGTGPTGLHVGGGEIQAITPCELTSFKERVTKWDPEWNYGNAGPSTGRHWWFGLHRWCTSVIACKCEWKTTIICRGAWVATPVGADFAFTANLIVREEVPDDSTGRKGCKALCEERMNAWASKHKKGDACEVTLDYKGEGKSWWRN